MLDPKISQKWLYVNFTIAKNDLLVLILRMVWNLRFNRVGVK